MDSSDRNFTTRLELGATSRRHELTEGFAMTVPVQYPPYYKLPADRRSKAEQSLREFLAGDLSPDVAMERLWNILVHPDIYEPEL